MKLLRLIFDEMKKIPVNTYLSIVDKGQFMVFRIYGYYHDQARRRTQIAIEFSLMQDVHSIEAQFEVQYAVEKFNTLLRSSM